MSVFTPADGALLAVSAALGARDGVALEAALRRAHQEGDPRAVEEAILQSYLFLGYPAALNAFATWRSLSGRDADGPSGDTGPWDERGARVCQEVYGGQYERLRSNIRALHPDMEQWMVNEGYGKVLGRPGLALGMRELCIATLLAALDAPRQLYSHLRGALNTGASQPQVEEALHVAAAVSAPDVARRALQTWDTLRTRTTGED